MDQKEDQKGELTSKVVKSAVRIVPISSLNYDRSYQRELKPRHKKIAKNFDKEAFGVPLIGQRVDGSLWVVDGQQRIGGISLLGHTSVRVEIFASRGTEHEAAIYKLVNMNRTPLSAAEEFKALLAADDASAWEIKEAVERCGFFVMTTQSVKSWESDKAWKVVQCIKSLRNIHRLHGVEPIEFALNVAKQCWPGDSKGTHNYMMIGMAALYRKYEGLIDQKRLVPRLQATTPQKILYTANQMTVGGDKASEVLAVLDKIYHKRFSKPR